MVTITSGFARCGMWFRIPITLSSSSKGIVFRFLNKFTSEVYHHTIIVGHGWHIWNHQRTMVIFGDNWHHHTRWFHLTIWQLLWLYVVDVKSSTIYTFYGMERFNKEYMRNASTPSIQQPCGQPNKAMPQKTKRPNKNKLIPHHILLKARSSMWWSLLPSVTSIVIYVTKQLFLILWGCWLTMVC
jgi:hypothetical protein